MPEDDIKGDSSSLIRFIRANMCHISLSSLFLNNTSGLQSPSLALLIGQQSCQSWGLNFDVYHTNSKSLAKARRGWQKDWMKKASDPTMIVLEWYNFIYLFIYFYLCWFHPILLALKPLKPSPHLAIQKKMKPSQQWKTTGRAQCLLVVLDWHYSGQRLFVCLLWWVWGVATAAEKRQRGE